MLFLSTGVITAAYSIHSCYLSCLVIGEYIALHHIVSIAARHAVVLRISVFRNLLVNAYSYARFSMYCVYTRLVNDVSVLFECQFTSPASILNNLSLKGIVLLLHAYLIRMRLPPCLTTFYTSMRSITCIR